MADKRALVTECVEKKFFVKECPKCKKLIILDDGVAIQSCDHVETSYRKGAGYNIVFTTPEKSAPADSEPAGQ